MKKSDDRFLVDDISFPLMYFPSGRGVLFPQGGVAAMFDDLIKSYGSGGETILYRSGHAVGWQGSDQLAKLFGEESMLQNASVFTKLYTALGWGRMEVVQAADDFKSFTLKLVNGFESEGVKAMKPNCHFSRGLIAGSTERLLGKSTSCVEMSCASSGNPFCLFVVSTK